VPVKGLGAESERVKPAEEGVEDCVVGDIHEEVDGEELVPGEGVLS